MPRVRRVTLLALLLLLAAIAPVAAQPVATPAASPEPSASPAATPVASSAIAAWLVLGPEGAVTARAIASDACPGISIDGVDYLMDIRARATEGQPVTVCETAVPADASTVQVGATSLRMPVADPQRIVVIGDTGCRMKEGDAFQACNDPEEWPFATVAAQAAAWQPDLVIHVGDYHYRETVCPEGDPGCAGSPWGDTWASWEADFFAPAAPLLQAAPWIMLRGNHEDCSRAGGGWFRYLDPRPLPAGCLDMTEPYAVPVGDTTAIVLDAAAAGDTSSDASTTDAYRAQLAEVERLAAGGPAWLLTHRPFWSIADDGSGGHVEWTTATYVDAGYAAPPAGIDLVVAGHVHNAQLLTFTPASGRPFELIAGHSGTSLEMESGTFTGADVGDDGLATAWRYAAFGFAGIEVTGSGLVVSVRMLDGSAPSTCIVTAAAAACVP